MAATSLDERRSGLSLLRSYWPAWLDVFGWVGRISETRYWAWLMLLPGFLLISVVIFYPVISGMWLSLHEYNLLRPARGQPFVGLQQFIDLLETRSSGCRCATRPTSASSTCSIPSCWA